MTPKHFLLFLTQEATHTFGLRTRTLIRLQLGLFLLQESSQPVLSFSRHRSGISGHSRKACRAIVGGGHWRRAGTCALVITSGVDRGGTAARAFGPTIVTMPYFPLGGATTVPAASLAVRLGLRLVRAWPSRPPFIQSATTACVKAIAPFSSLVTRVWAMTATSGRVGRTRTLVAVAESTGGDRRA